MSRAGAAVETEHVDDVGGIVIRRIAVGPMATNCYALHAVGSPAAMLVDPGGEAGAILDATSDLDVRVIVLTHTHWDHVEGLAEVHDALGVPIAAHPDDGPVWPHEQEHLRDHGHWDAGTATEALLGEGCDLRPPPELPLWDGTVHRTLAHGDILRVGELELAVLHTPGHTPGGISLHLGHQVLTGDTLFPGGPGLTGWPFSDFTTIVRSITGRLLTLAADTVVHPGHGEPTTIGHEAPHLDDWVARGW